MAESNYDYVDEKDGTQIAQGNLRAFSAILLVLLILVSFVGNVLLAATVFASASLRRRMFNVLLSNVALVNLVDTALNMFLSLIYIATGRWTMSQQVCNVNAALIILVGLETVAAITLMAFDRAVALLDLNRYKERLESWSNATGCVVSVWCLGVLAASPVAVGVVGSRVYSRRYFCAVSAGSPLAYALLLATLYTLCLLLLLLSFLIILYRAQQARRTTLPSPQGQGRTALHVHEFRQFADNLSTAKFCLLLFVVYFILHGPYTLLSLLGQAAAAGDALLDVDVNVDAEAETAISWLKFLFPVVFPFLAFAFCPSLWDKCSALLCCANGGGGGGGGGGDMFAANLVNAADANGRATMLVATELGLQQQRRGSDNYSNADVESSTSSPRRSISEGGGGGSKQQQEWRSADRPTVRQSEDEEEGAESWQRADSWARTSDYDSEDSCSWADERSSQQQQEEIEKSNASVIDEAEPATEETRVSESAGQKSQASQSQVKMEDSERPNKSGGGDSAQSRQRRFVPKKIRPAGPSGTAGINGVVTPAPIPIAKKHRSQKSEESLENRSSNGNQAKRSQRRIASRIPKPKKKKW